MEELLKVKNRSKAFVGYAVKDKNVVRDFSPMEIKKIPKDELQQLSYQPGGKTILKEYLQILTDDKEFLQELFGEKIEPEYNYSKEDAVNIMLNGSLDAFLDMLDFAPKAILDIIKTEAVECKLNDVSKRKAIKEKIGFDVDSAIKNAEEDKKEEQLKENSERERRVPIKEEVPKRRIVE